MNANSHRRALPLFLMTIALLVAACGDGAGGDDGAGNGGADCQDDGCAGNGGSGAGDTTTTTGNGGTGGGDVCHPNVANDYCAGEPDCECRTTLTTDPSFCAQWEAEGVELCPNGPGECSPGSNTCGYDLPQGQAYEPPDPTCIGYVNGDTWAGNMGQSSIGGGAGYDANGQFRTAFGNLFGGEAGYYNDFVMAGRKFFWNRGISAQTESGEGEITSDCKYIAVDFFYAGETTPYASYDISWVHQ